MIGKNRLVSKISEPIPIIDSKIYQLINSSVQVFKLGVCGVNKDPHIDVFDPLSMYLT